MPVLSKDKLAPCSSMHEFGVELACVASSAIPVQSSLPPPRKARLLQNQINLLNLISLISDHSCLFIQSCLSPHPTSQRVCTL